MIEEEEERVGILRKAYLRRRCVREDGERDAVALPAQRIGERAKELNGPPPAIWLDVLHVHGRRTVLENDDVGARLADDRDPGLRAGQRDDAEGRCENERQPEREV